MEPNDLTPPTPPEPPVPQEGTVTNKYIRTFAGDMEILKQGGVPDLAPLVDATPKERLVEGSPLPPEPPTPTLSEVETAPAEPATSSPLPPAEPVTPTLKTYAGDFLDRVGETQASTATVLAAEQDSMRPTNPEPSSKSNLPYIIGGSALLILGVVGGVFAYLQYKTNNAPVVLAPTISAPIVAEERTVVTGTGVLLQQAIEQSVTDPLATGAVRLLYSESTTTPDVFTSLEVSAPGVLLRNIDPAGSMAGVINVGGIQSPFFILSVLSYGETFSGMLQWESTMLRDLRALFPAYPAPVVVQAAPPATTTATTTKTTSQKTSAAPATTTPKNIVPPYVPEFRDEVIGNHDVRAYRDAQRKIVLVYGYWNQRTLVIARDQSAFAELLSRLAAARTP